MSSAQTLSGGLIWDTKIWIASERGKGAEVQGLHTSMHSCSKVTKSDQYHERLCLRPQNQNVGYICFLPALRTSRDQKHIAILSRCSILQISNRAASQLQREGAVARIQYSRFIGVPIITRGNSAGYDAHLDRIRGACAQAGQCKTQRHNTNSVSVIGSR